MTNNGADSRLEHQTIKVKQLISDYQAGRIVIPEFQRDYVWKQRKAPLLIDSLYRGYPISSLLLWQCSDEVRTRRKEQRLVRSSLLTWLIDGQQRVITLTRIFNGEDNFDVVFNPNDETFQLSNAATRNDKNWFRVADLWDNEEYIRIRRNMDGGAAANRREAKFEKVRRVLDYEIPLVRMIDHSFDDAVNSFKRINTLGVRLKVEDIHSAEVAAKHSGFVADEVAPYLENLRNQGFTRLNVMHLFRACACVAKPDGRNRTPLHMLEKDEVLDAWKRTKYATEQAIGLVRSGLGLINMDILWSGALLVPIIVNCSTTAPRDRDVSGLVAWLSLAALLHRYSSGSEAALDQDLKACRAADPVGALLSNLRQYRSSLLAEPKDFSGSINDKSGLMALYVACKYRGIEDFFSGGKILLQNQIDRHHILPRAQFSLAKRADADNIANIAFISNDVNKSINSSGPEVYLKDVKESSLISQCIPLDESFWAVKRAEDFWAARRELLAESFNEFIKSAIPQRRLV